MCLESPWRAFNPLLTLAQPLKIKGGGAKAATPKAAPASAKGAAKDKESKEPKGISKAYIDDDDTSDDEKPAPFGATSAAPKKAKVKVKEEKPEPVIAAEKVWQ